MTIELASLTTLARTDLAGVLSALGADGGDRTQVTGYEALSDVELVKAPGGERIFVRGDRLMLVFVADANLPPGTDHAALVAAVGDEGERLRSRQGRHAVLHVVADSGVAWSEERGEVEFVEIFPPTTLEAYRSEIYEDPGEFIR
jgi:hypothetical protein